MQIYTSIFKINTCIQFNVQSPNICQILCGGHKEIKTTVLAFMIFSATKIQHTAMESEMNQ